MTRDDLIMLQLQLRLWLVRQPIVALLAGLLALLGALSWLWLLPQQQALRKPLIEAPAAATAAPVQQAPVSAAQGLADFYAAMGPARHPEEDVRTLFQLARRNGLQLSQGQYDTKPDPSAHLLRYQIVLPLKGEYSAVWSFAQMAMLAVPFASLDELSFQREAIGDEAVEASLRFTFYLNTGGATP